MPSSASATRGAEREDVAAHRLELLVRNLDDLDASLVQQFDEPHRHQRRVDEREVTIERTDEGQEVHDLAGTVVVGQVDRRHFDAWKRRIELAGAGLVRSVAETDDERLLVEPERVPALGQRRFCELGRDWHPGRREVRAHHRDLAAPLDLPRAEQDRSLACDQGWVVDVDRVEIAVRGARGDHHLGSGLGESSTEALVLLRDAS